MPLLLVIGAGSFAVGFFSGRGVDGIGNLVKYGVIGGGGLYLYKVLK